jgi:hypothetical protein
MSSVCPKMIAAPSGPMPWMSVSVRARSENGRGDALVGSEALVVEPAEIAHQLERDPFAFGSTGPSGRTPRTIRPAWEADNRRPAPPGVKAQSRKWSRQIAWVRSPVRSWCRSATSHSTTVCDPPR